MARVRYPARLAAERSYSYRVDIPVPPLGMGGRLNEMHAWCGEHVEGEWERHGITDRGRRDARGIPMDFARFYFENQSDADAFRATWLDDRNSV